MPEFISRIFTRAAPQSSSGTIPVNRFEGITSDGRVVMRDRRGTRKAEIPNTDLKSETLSNDPLAIYKPDGAKHIDAAKALGNFTGWTFAAVNAIAREAAGIQLRLYKVSGNDHRELDNHPLLDLLDTVNPHMTGVELKYTLMAHLELTGNAFWLLDGVKDERSQPRAIYPLNPGRMRVKLDKSSFPYKLSHYEFTIDGKVITFQPYQILHLKYPDPSDPYVGVGVPQTIPVWIDSDNYAMEYNRKYFINGAGIGLYIATQTNVEGQIERIKQGFKDAYSGVDNAHKTPVLPKGVDLKNAGVTHRDMEFEKLAMATRDRILAAFGVSKTILGTAESDTNRATAETADYVFSKRTMKPKMQLVLSYLNEFLIPRYGDDLYLTFIDPTPEDKEFRTKEMQAAVGNMPIMTQNEARRSYLGLGAIEGGDQLMTPSTMTAAGITDKPEGEDQAPQLVRTVDGWRAKAIRVRIGGKRAPISKVIREITEAFAATLDRAPAFQVKSITELTHAEYMEHYKRFDARSEQAETELRQVFHGINAKQKEDVLENLPDATGVKKFTRAAREKAIGQLFDPQEWIGITIDLATPILSRLTKDEATAALAMIGAEHQDILANESTQQALERGIAKMARSYNATTLDQLTKVLTDKLNQPGGTNMKELTDAVDGVYSFADERRAGLIAKTESYRAANWANKEAWQQSGVVKTVQWYSAEDSHVCEFCAAMEAEGPVPIETVFADAGSKVAGTEGGLYTADYGDVDAPPLHPLCRCYLRPESISIE
jgi:HK97 family phage portal protein